MNRKKQYLIPGNDLDAEVMHLEHWDLKTAARLIAAGLEFPSSILAFNERLANQGIADWLEADRSAKEAIAVTTRIAQSSIKAGKLKDPDSKANWLTWAKSKGYDISHLTGEASSAQQPTTTERPTPNALIDFDALSDEQLIGFRDVCTWLKRSESSVRRDIQNKAGFPKPVSTGGRSVRFKAGEVRNYIKSLK
jgi:predicted DNA-binding transcriptional regulator AlpA